MTSSLHSPPKKRPKLDCAHDCCCTVELPIEVLEQIFATLPIYSLGLCRLVCRFWNCVISKPKYLHWKKHYHSIKNDNRDVLATGRILLLLNNRHNFLPSLIKIVDEEFNNAHDYILYADVLKTKFDYISKIASTLIEDKEKFPSYPAIISLLFVFCDSVEQIIDYIYSILSLVSNISYFFDFFYFLLYIFYKLWRNGNLPHRLHFNLFHAIVSIESSTTTNSHSNDSLLLTEEQQKIIQHPLAPNDIIKIEAFAGTGKTTTLAKLAESRPSTVFLYVAFNQSMVMAANEMFQLSNVHCRTFHSIAHNAVITHLNYPRSKLYFGSLEHYHLYNFLPDTTKRWFMAKWLLKCLDKFFASDSETLGIRHVPLITDVTEDYFENECEDIDGHQRQKIFEIAKQIWEEMIDRENKDALLPHDGYLKLFQLNKLKILGYNCLLIDEAQDITPAIKSIIDNQNLCKIFVGDPHQGIYSFRGAYNALSTIRGTTSFYLTQSFRFGTNIAYLASCILDVLKGVHKKTITGSLKPGGFSGVVEGQVAFIGRTNAILFETAVDFCLTHPSSTISFTSTNKKEFKLLRDIYSFRKGKTKDIKDKKITKYKSYNDMKESASDDMKRKIKLVEKYGDHIPEYLDLLESLLISDWRQAEYVFTTAHKSKGLEFDTVVVCDGFIPEYFTGQKRGFELLVDEKNLLYVSVTRAKKQVIINKDILRLLATANEHFMNLTTNCNTEDTPCAVCQEDMTSSYIYRSGIELNFPGLNSTVRHHSCSREGPVCSQCAVKHMPFLKPILEEKVIVS